MASSTIDRDDQSRRPQIIWLDEYMYRYGNGRTLNQFRETHPDAKAFTSQEECVKYVREQNNRTISSEIIFIVSGSLSEKTMIEVEANTCVLAFFIFCINADKYQGLKSEHRKLRAIFTDSIELADSIELFLIKHIERTEFSILPNQQPSSADLLRSSNQRPIVNLREDQASFLWHSQMHKFMLELSGDDDKEAKKRMLVHCYQQYDNNPRILSQIEQFEHESVSDNKKKALHWYTDNCFIHECINTILRKENIGLVYSFRYIIKLICRQLKKEHTKFIEQYKREGNKPSLTLYRGQYFKPEQIRLLKKNLNNLISLNGFVSTTRSKDIARDFIKNRMQEGFEPVLMEIVVDMSGEHNVAFADISDFSKFPEEEEVLLSIGSVFRVKSVSYDEELAIHRVYLALSHHDQTVVIKYIDQTYATSTDSAEQEVLFGKLMFEMGEPESAIQYFRDARRRLTGDNQKMQATYLNNIGVCYNEIGNSQKALDYYKRALEIYEEIGDTRGIGSCQHNIASIYHVQGKHSEARKLADEALLTREKHKVEQASTLNLLGSIVLALKDAEDARNKFEDALKLRLKYLGKTDSHHPDIAVSYQNLAEANMRLVDRTEAKICYEKAAEIYRHTYPITHPLVVRIEETLKKFESK